MVIRRAKQFVTIFDFKNGPDRFQLYLNRDTKY